MRLSILMLAATFGLSANAHAAPSTGCDGSVRADPKVAVVCEMVDAWEKLDWNRSAELFAEDGVLESVMVEPVRGREAIRKRVSGIGASVTRLKFHILNIGRVGDVVFLERIDEFTSNGHEGRVPIVGVFEVENGKVKLWREYFDRAMLFREMRLNEDLKAGSWTPM